MARPPHALFHPETWPPAVRGALWMMASATMWTVMVAIARGLSKDVHTFEIVFFRSFFALVFFLPWLLRFGRSGLRTDRPFAHLYRGLSGLAALYLLFGALYFTPMAEVTAITFVRPVFASIGAIVFLHEVASGRRWSACIVGLVGTLIIVRPGVAALDIGHLLAIGCVVCMSITALTVKSLARTEKPDTIAFYQVVVFSTVSLVPMLFVWTVPDPISFWLLVLMGLCGNWSQRAMTRAYVAADATVVLPFEYIRLPISALFGLVLFGEFPDGWTWVGGAVIFLSTWYMAHSEARAVRKPAAAE